MNRISLLPNRLKAIRQVLALFVALCLSLPNPAFALRQLNAGMEESPVNQELRNQFRIPGRIRERQTTGMEEGDLVQKELVQIASNPRNEDENVQERLKWLSDRLGDLNVMAGGLFTETEVGTLSQKLLSLFSLKGVGGNEIVYWGREAYFIEQDMGSGETMAQIRWDKATGGLIPDTAGTEKKKLVYDLFGEWEATYRLPKRGGNSKAAVEKFRQEVSARYPSVQLVEDERAAASRIEVAAALLSLLPEAMLGSQIVGHRLRGGIHLNAPRDESTRIAHYKESIGQLGMQNTIFSRRGFIQSFLHEFGHVVEPEHLTNEQFLALVGRAKEDLYALPSMDQTGDVRKRYISTSADEVFGESFMHYILHGELMAQGFPDLVKDQGLWKEMYGYYRDHVFYGVEYRIQAGKLTATPAGTDRQPAAGMEETAGYHGTSLYSLYGAILAKKKGDSDQLRLWSGEKARALGIPIFRNEWGASDEWIHITPTSVFPLMYALQSANRDRFPSKESYLAYLRTLKESEERAEEEIRRTIKGSWLQSFREDGREKALANYIGPPLPLDETDVRKLTDDELAAFIANQPDFYHIERSKRAIPQIQQLIEALSSPKINEEEFQDIQGFLQVPVILGVSRTATNSDRRVSGVGGPGTIGGDIPIRDYIDFSEITELRVPPEHLPLAKKLLETAGTPEITLVPDVVLETVHKQFKVGSSEEPSPLNEDSLARLDPRAKVAQTQVDLKALVPGTKIVVFREPGWGGYVIEVERGELAKIWELSDHPGYYRGPLSAIKTSMDPSKPLKAGFLEEKRSAIFPRFNRGESENLVDSKGSDWSKINGIVLIESSAAGLEEMKRWIQGLEIWSRPIESVQLDELKNKGRTVAEVRGVPSFIRLTTVTQGILLSDEISRGRQVMAQSDLLPDQTLKFLAQRFGIVEPLPRSLSPEAVARLVSRLKDLDVQSPKALLLVEPETAEQIKAALAEVDPEWKVPVFILGIPKGLLGTTDPDGVLAYLLNLLAQVDQIPGRHIERLESTLTLETKHQTLFLSSGA